MERRRKKEKKRKEVKMTEEDVEDIHAWFHSEEEGTVADVQNGQTLGTVPISSLEEKPKKRKRKKRKRCSPQQKEEKEMRLALIRVGELTR